MSLWPDSRKFDKDLLQKEYYTIIKNIVIKEYLLSWKRESQCIKPAAS